MLTDLAKQSQLDCYLYGRVGGSIIAESTHDLCTAQTNRQNYVNEPRTKTLPLMLTEIALRASHLTDQ